MTGLTPGSCRISGCSITKGSLPRNTPSLSVPMMACEVGLQREVMVDELNMMSWYLPAFMLVLCMCVCMCVCVCVCMYVSVNVCTYVCMLVCIYACMYVCMYVCLYVCMCACMSVCMSVCIYVYMHVCTRVKTTNFGHSSN